MTHKQCLACEAKQRAQNSNHELWKASALCALLSAVIIITAAISGA